MIKTFEQFINEDYNVSPVLAYGQEYGAPLFNEISESLVDEMYNSINEGKLVIDTDMIEEGIFDTIGKLFKKGSKIAKEKNDDTKERIEDTHSTIDHFNKLGMLDGDDLIEYGKSLKKLNIETKVYSKIEELYNSAEEICANLAKKEESVYKTISEKMTAANEAVKEFTETSIAKIKEIIEISKNKVSDVIAAVIAFGSKMVEFAKNAMVNIGKGAVIAFALPFIFAYSVYKGAVSLCAALVEKVKDGAKFIKDTFGKIKNAISKWVSDSLTKAKETLKSACDDVKDGAKKAYNAIGKAYLAIVGILGQLASDIKDMISDAYNKFVDGVEDLADEVKTFVSDKWNIVSNWCKKTATSFAEGVKNVWEKVKGKVMDGIESVKDAYQELEDEADATWNDVKSWGDKKQQDMFKAMFKYASDKWGADEVKSWF
jgi:gas vesicle protein